MANAAPTLNPIDSAPPTVPDNPLSRVATGIIPIVTTIIGIIAVLYVLYNGYRYITAGGDTKKTAEARAGLVSGIVGVIIVVLTYTIINFSMSLGSVFSNAVNPTPAATTAASK